MFSFAAFVFANFVALNLAADNYLIFSNYCEVSVWVGMSADYNGATPTWWDDGNPMLASGASQNLTLSDVITSIAVWGRTKCDFSTHENDVEYVCCATGDCGCRKVCTTGIKYGGTQAEITFGNPDNYDLSNIEGFHLPMTIKPIAPYTDTSGDLSCTTGGEPYESITDWAEKLLGGCQSYKKGENLVYSVANYDLSENLYKCDIAGTESIQDVRFCVKEFSINATQTPSYTEYESFCKSDKAIAGFSAVTGSARPSSWPGYGTTTFDKYDCPAPPYEKCTCPANYQCLKDGDSLPGCSSFGCDTPYSGEPPYTDWNTMMYNQGINEKTYLFVYDDPVALMTCNTAEGSRAYEVTFCPANSGMFTTAIPSTTVSNGNSANDYFILFGVLLPFFVGYFV